jgi:hypothetical protein
VKPLSVEDGTEAKQRVLAVYRDAVSSQSFSDGLWRILEGPTSRKPNYQQTFEREADAWKDSARFLPKLELKGEGDHINCPKHGLKFGFCEECIESPEELPPLDEQCKKEIGDLGHLDYLAKERCVHHCRERQLKQCVAENKILQNKVTYYELAVKVLESEKVDIPSAAVPVEERAATPKMKPDTADIPGHKMAVRFTDRTAVFGCECGAWAEFRMGQKSEMAAIFARNLHRGTLEGGEGR